MTAFGTYTPGSRGQYWGPPEHCYEAEAPCIDEFRIYAGKIDDEAEGDDLREILCWPVVNKMFDEAGRELARRERTGAAGMRR
jgi:hypothetical protein